MRILIKGGSVSGFSHDEAEWNEPVNIKDYDVAILNLNGIIENAGELATPSSSIPESIEFPPIEDILKLLRAGNELYIFLPETRKINLIQVDDGDTSKEEVDLLSWLPFHIETVEESGRSVNQKSVPSGWRWYFDGDFDWPMYISGITMKDGVLPINRMIENTVQNTIAQTTFEEDIASQVTISLGVDIATQIANDNQESVYPGVTYLLPPKPDSSFGEAAAEMLSQFYGLSTESGSVPDWAEKKRLPRQQEILKRSQELKEEFERLEQFRKLLYADGSELEEVVLTAFEELGFETTPEISGKRDGAVLLDEKAFVLETHGTENAIGVGKVDQLDRWVRDAEEDFEDRDIEGLLVANSYRKQKPENRGQPIAGDPKKHLQDYGHKLLTTTQLYYAIQRNQRDDLSPAEIKEILQEPILCVEFN
jgi:hypothetical protein